MVIKCVYVCGGIANKRTWKQNISKCASTKSIKKQIQVQGKFIPVRAMKACEDSRGRAPLILISTLDRGEK